MKKGLARAYQWLDERTEISAVRDLLAHKTVPQHRHSIWYYFGGITLFLFGVQVFTGILLMLYYRPSAEAAFESVQFIVTQVTFGWLIRSSAFLVGKPACRRRPDSLLFRVFHACPSGATRAHMVQRLSASFADARLRFFSGYLLPWNQLSYFATKVGTEIPAQIPLIGSYIADFLRGGEYVTGGHAFQVLRLACRHPADDYNRFPCRPFIACAASRNERTDFHRRALHKNAVHPELPAARSVRLGPGARSPGCSGRPVSLGNSVRKPTRSARPTPTSNPSGISCRCFTHSRLYLAVTSWVWKRKPGRSWASVPFFAFAFFIPFIDQRLSPRGRRILLGARSVRSDLHRDHDGDRIRRLVACLGYRRDPHSSVADRTSIRTKIGEVGYETRPRRSLDDLAVDLWYGSRRRSGPGRRVVLHYLSPGTRRPADRTLERRCTRSRGTWLRRFVTGAILRPSLRMTWMPRWRLRPDLSAHRIGLKFRPSAGPVMPMRSSSMRTTRNFEPIN